ncbi:MAG: nitroreductase family deazaflavin-dependent oxidoreductase [Gammaproteobacteria bacterium]|nr:nitroreductase family deazaflavin-dependent oxidoreductase [Gammaproteobacteria bacterium]
MSDPAKEASERGWIAEHRAKYLADGASAHLWDSTIVGGPGPLPTLLLTTRGRKSGQDSLMPLLYGEVPGGYAIIASKGGAPKHPGWYHNLRAQATVGVQIANDAFQARWRQLAGDERGRVWRQMEEMYPPFTGYQAKTSREIPVVVLQRVS